MKIRVYYEDTDAGGIVYHTNYLKYCERARSEMFFSQNMMPKLSKESGFVVRDLKASFLSTATLGDMLEVTTKIVSLKSSSLKLLQEIWRESVKLFSMEILLVYTHKRKPSRIPEEFKTLFKEHCC